MNKYQERIACFRQYMKEQNINITLIPTNDFHNSEYVEDYFKLREYLTGFTGSAGTLLLSETEAFLFTDGRYFIQAERELMGSGVTLYRSGMPEVPTPEEKLCLLLESGGTFGFDGRLLSYRFVETVQKSLKNPESVTLRSDFIYPDFLWPNRPELTSKGAFRLPAAYAGKSVPEKLALVRKGMNSDLFLLSALDEIAWLFNLRGHDVLYTPVVLSYALITKNDAFLYLLSSAVTKELTESFQNEGVTIRPYEQIYKDLPEYKNSKVLLNTKSVNYALAASLSESCTLQSAPGPILIEKAVKNEIELQNLKKAHIMDGVAMTRFMYWLKHEMKRGEITEYSAAEKLLSFRKQEKAFLEPSFETISAYNENAAMMHYTATKKSAAKLSSEGFLLVDSGGQYLEGTTDVTRTYALGPIPEEWKRNYTAVLRGMLDLTSAKFLEGCRGVNLDILARGPLWQLSLDYRCGTGHGVGYFLSVHEAPNGFRWRIVPERDDSCILTEGMVTTNEPGVYVEGSHGIRIENELVCQKEAKNEYGQFLSFSTLTMTPIDLTPVLTEALTNEEKTTLNAYHETVYQTIAPFLSEAESKWLFEITRPI